MSYLNLAPVSHYKKDIIKQQSVGVASAQMTQLTSADFIGANAGDAQLTNGVVPTPDNIFLQSLPGNTGTITIMPVNPAVSLGAGYILSPGQTVSLPTKKASEWYVIASAAAQGLNIHYQYGIT